MEIIFSRTLYPLDTIISLSLCVPVNLRAIDILSWHLILCDHHRSAEMAVSVAPGAGIDQLMLCRRLGGERGKGNIGRWVVVTARTFFHATQIYTTCSLKLSFLGFHLHFSLNCL